MSKYISYEIMGVITYPRISERSKCCEISGDLVKINSKLIGHYDELF